MFNRLLSRFIASYVAIFSLVFPPALIANPSGHTVISGDINVSGSGNTLDVNQGSQRGILNWESFSIGNGQTANFNLPSQTAAILNRVTGGDISRILGTLNSNGNVFLINQNGVVIGQNGSINTQSFIASTLNVKNKDFLKGGDLKFSGSDSDATIINLGSITAKGGDVFLIAQKVVNRGMIIAKKGDVGLAGGTTVILKESGENRISVKVSGKESGSVTHSGYIEAARAELRAAGNNPYALAVNHTGVTRAIGFKKIGGRVVLSSDGGRTRVGGRIETDKKGLLETTGDSVVVANNFNVDTKNGQWVIDSNRFRVAEEGGNISGATLSNQLENNNVIIQTTHEDSQDNGDIVIADDISWASNNNLSAKSSANVRVFNSITSKGKSDISLIAGKGANGSSELGFNLDRPQTEPQFDTRVQGVQVNSKDGSKGGDVVVNADIKTKGSIELTAGNGGNGAKGSGEGISNKSGGNGGAGGSVRVNTDLKSKNQGITINSGNGGKGGDAFEAKQKKPQPRRVAIDEEFDGPRQSPTDVLEANFGRANGGNGGDAGNVVINGKVTAKNDIEIASGNGGNGGKGVESHSFSFLDSYVDGSRRPTMSRAPRGDSPKTGDGGNAGNGGNIVINSKVKSEKGSIVVESGNGGRGGNGADGIDIENVLDDMNVSIPSWLIKLSNGALGLGLGNAGNGGDAGAAGNINIGANIVAKKDITIDAGNAGKAGNGGDSAGLIRSAKDGHGGHGANGGFVVVNGKVKSAKGDINVNTGEGSNAGNGALVYEKVLSESQPRFWWMPRNYDYNEVNRDGLGGNLVLNEKLKTSKGDINVTSARNIVFNNNGKMVAKKKGNINVVAEDNLVNNRKSNKIFKVNKGRFLVLSDSPETNKNAFNTGEDFYQFGVKKLKNADGEGSGLLFRNKLAADVVVKNQKITYGQDLKGSKYELSNFVIIDSNTKEQKRVSEQRLGLNTSLLLEVTGSKKIETSTSGNYVAGKHENSLTVENKSNMKINSLEKGDLKVKQKKLRFDANGVDKVFDGNTSAQIEFGSDNRIKGDLFDILAAKANFENAEVGSDKYINAMFELFGEDAANYKLVNRKELFASITAEETVVTGVQTQAQPTTDKNLQGIFNIGMGKLGSTSGSTSGNGGVDKDASMGSEL